MKIAEVEAWKFAVAVARLDAKDAGDREAWDFFFAWKNALWLID